jgi:hypothetical protein
MHRSMGLRRAAAATCAVLLWATGLIVPQPTSAATYADCDNSAVQYPEKIGMARMMRTSGTFDGIIGDQYVRTLHSCSNPAL